MPTIPNKNLKKKSQEKEEKECKEKNQQSRQNSKSSKKKKTKPIWRKDEKKLIIETDVLNPCGSYHDQVNTCFIEYLIKFSVLF